jgi:hypothetical protein
LIYLPSGHWLCLFLFFFFSFSIAAAAAAALSCNCCDATVRFGHFTLSDRRDSPASSDELSSSEDSAKLGVLDNWLSAESWVSSWVSGQVLSHAGCDEAGFRPPFGRSNSCSHRASFGPLGHPIDVVVPCLFPALRLPLVLS